MEVVAVAILQSRNFKVVYVKLFLVKHNSIFFGGGGDITTEKTAFFLLRFIFEIILQRILRKKNL